MLYSVDRHESIAPLRWDEDQVREAIVRIVQRTEAAFTPEGLWPLHPNDGKDPAPKHMLYFGAGGVFWALHHLQARGAVRLQRDYGPHVRGLLAPNRAAMGYDEGAEGVFGSYLMGDTGLLLLDHVLQPTPHTAATLERLIEATIDHPARELMWGAPGTLLAAWFLHGHSGEARWADLFRATASHLWSQLEWSDEWHCHYWTQDLYGRRATYLDAVHGFVATAAALIHGRGLLGSAEWTAWRDCIANTVQRTAERDGALANWRARLLDRPGTAKLVQFCHGAPGFVICLADFPDDTLDDLLLAGGETTWQAGPLRKGGNLCHGTGGNGYAFLKLYRRFGDPRWLERARAFAMHGIAQVEADFARHGQARHSLWTGDPGFALYLLDCLEATDRFPTLDVFFADA
jgi:hypothetical protein